MHTFCVDLEFDPATTRVYGSYWERYPLPHDRYWSALEFLGFEVVESGCDARLRVALAGAASPAYYGPSGELTCYLAVVPGVYETRAQGTISSLSQPWRCSSAGTCSKPRSVNGMPS